MERHANWIALPRLAAAALAGVLALAAHAHAQGVPEIVAAGIGQTKHNLSTTGTGTIRVNPASPDNPTNEVCVFCHTPHGGQQTAPLWNRALSTAAYTMYSSPTFDSEIGAAPIGVSTACLSCHDGTIAFDAIRNLPGSGGFVGYGNEATATGTTTWTFLGTPDKKMPNTTVALLGTDLSDDHPISMVYPHANAGQTDNTKIDPKFNAPGTGAADERGGTLKRRRVTSPFNSALGPILYESADNYDNNVWVFQVAAGGKFYVQCTSCHNPHGSAATTNSGGSGTVGNIHPTFLRRSNKASELCLTCHQK